MPVSETFPLQPDEAAPIFIGAGVLKTHEDLRQFSVIEDPLLRPTLTRGSYTWDEWAGNKGSGSGNDFTYDPRRKAAGNAIGLRNQGRQGIDETSLITDELEAAGFDIITSITNLPHEKAIQVLPKLATYAVAHGAKIIEVNLSCPNGLDDDGNLHAPVCNTPDESAAIMEAVDAEVGDAATLGAKDGPHTASPDQPVDRIAVYNLITKTNSFVDFFTGINTIGGQEFEEITVTNGKGGMSGPIVSSVAKQWLEYAREAATDGTAILSLGGVESATAAVEITERRALGALLVGGTQEFYRSTDHVKTALDWARRYHSS